MINNISPSWVIDIPDFVYDDKVKDCEVSGIYGCWEWNRYDKGRSADSMSVPGDEYASTLGILDLRLSREHRVFVRLENYSLKLIF